MTVEEHYRLCGAALLGVEAAAVGRGDGVDALGRDREAIVGVGIRRVMEPGEDMMLIDRDAAHKRTREGTNYCQRCPRRRDPYCHHPDARRRLGMSASTRTSSTSPIVRSWVMASRNGRWGWIA